MPSPQSRKKRGLGLSKAQSIILGIALWCVIGVFVVAVALLLEQRSRTTTVGATPQAAAAARVAPTYPPTWTPTPVPTPRSTVTLSPSFTPDVLAAQPTTTPLGREGDPPLPTPGVPTATPPGEDITDPNYLTGKEAYQAKNYQEVLRRMESVLKADPNLAAPHWYRGMAYWYLKDFQAMLQEMEQALALDPQYALAYAGRGLAYSDLGNRDQAFKDWRQALRLDPTLAVVHHNMAVVYNNDYDFARAIQEYKIALSIDPLRAVTWKSLAFSYRNNRQYQECLDSANRALELDSSLWEAHGWRATCSIHLGIYSESVVTDLEIFLEKDPGDAAGWNTLARMYLQVSDDAAKAITAYDRLLKLDPSRAAAYLMRAELHYRLAHYQQAIADYTQALKLQEMPEIYQGRARSYLALKQYAQAEADYRKVLVTTPDYYEATAGLAELYFAQSRYADVLEVTQRYADAQRFAPPAVLRWRGRAYYALKDYAKAIEALTLAAQFEAQSEDDYYLGIAYEAGGQKDEAITALSRFVENTAVTDKTLLEDARSRLARLQQ
jgi:tetratricopeptide (TPR) repeat protein